MFMELFDPKKLRKLWKPKNDSFGEDNGQITIIGGSELFTGAPILSAIAVSRMVDMVFLATPKSDREILNKINLFSKIRSVIWIPAGDIFTYIEKSDAVLIGPGMMRYRREGERIKDTENRVRDGAGRKTKKMTEKLLRRFPAKQWVIDGGSLQVMDKEWIPKGAILTPNRKEFQMLFGRDIANFDSADMADAVMEKAREYECIVVYKAPTSIVSDGKTTYAIEGGNAGLTKGGTGDVLAGVVTGLAAKNPPLLAAAAGSWLVKKTADYLYKKVGYNYNADDLANQVFEILKEEMG